MSPDEYTRIVRFVEERYPGTKNWRAPSIAGDFTRITYKATMKAIDEYRDDPSHQHAPKPMPIRARAMEIMRSEGELAPGTQNCDARGRHGALAILNHDDPEKAAEGLRIAICVECKSQWVGDARRFPTAGEIAEINATREAPGYTGPIPGDRTENIAP